MTDKQTNGEAQINRVRNGGQDKAASCGLASLRESSTNGRMDWGDSRGMRWDIGGACNQGVRKLEPGS